MSLVLQRVKMSNLANSYTYQHQQNMKLRGMFRVSGTCAIMHTAARVPQ
jgi:hypothetical protein